MQKNSIFTQRREMKKKSHNVIRTHYVVLIFLTLVLSLFGTEFTYSTMGWGKITGKDAASGENDPGNVFSAGDAVLAEDVLTLISTGKLEEGAARSEELSRRIQENGSTSAALGRTNGVLAQLVNAVGSGSLFVKLAQTVRTITRSDRAVAIIFVLGSFLWYALIFIFLKNVYSAVIRRTYLAARVYKKVSFQDVTHFAAVKKWFRASWVMLVQTVYLSLWYLTIIGGIIKSYSYWAVPYIVAENPAVSAKEAITLSRKMMNGHKLELFKYQVTLFGWMLLSVITFGISDLLYGAGYRMACYTEFYAKVREDAKDRGIAGTELLNDPYLFETADKILLYETYFEVVDEITHLHENQTQLTGLRKVFADWFGIWLGSLAQKKDYDGQEDRRFALQHYKLSMEGKEYPQWLNPLWKRKEIKKQGNFSYLRHYTVWTLFLLFITFAFIGWSWEVTLHFMQTGQFANRGTLHGPWLPIYGTGGIIVMILCSRFRKNPVAEFFTAIALCGVLEYVSAWYLETKYHTRWWSYDGYFFESAWADLRGGIAGLRSGVLCDRLYDGAGI